MRLQFDDPNETPRQKAVREAFDKMDACGEEWLKPSTRPASDPSPQKGEEEVNADSV